jgi:hypothetical protein
MKLLTILSLTIISISSIAHADVDSSIASWMQEIASNTEQARRDYINSSNEFSATKAGAAEIAAAITIGTYTGNCVEGSSDEKTKNAVLDVISVAKEKYGENAPLVLTYATKNTPKNSYCTITVFTSPIYFNASVSSGVGLPYDCMNNSKDRRVIGSTNSAKSLALLNCGAKCEISNLEYTAFSRPQGNACHVTATAIKKKR